MKIFSLAAAMFLALAGAARAAGWIGHRQHHGYQGSAARRKVFAIYASFVHPTFGTLSARIAR